MFEKIAPIFKIPELRRKLLFTVGLLCIYRVGFHVPLPGVDQQKLAEIASRGGGQDTAFGRITGYLEIFTGGSLRQSTLFGLGIMPYISAAIIFQLLISVVPSLEKMQREESGRRKIQEYTRYATVGLCIIQGIFWMNYMKSQGLIYPELADPTMPGWRYYLTSVFWVGLLGLTTGTIFLMWLGEQIDEYGIGNGISLIIMAGIIARMPWAISTVAKQASFSVEAGPGAMGPGKIIFLIAAFIFVVAGAILITQAQRRIPIQYAKQMRGRRVYGGQRQYLPLRVNHGGVMPIIFASSLMLFPQLIFDSIAKAQWARGNLAGQIFGFISESFGFSAYTYNLCYILLIFFFSYFWTTVQFRPKEMADQLREHGSFVPGLRPGRRTADYLERVLGRITYVGAAFLAIIAVVPTVVAVSLEIPYRVATFLGGTGLLIVVSVALDLVQRIEAQLIMRNYAGLLGEGGGRIRGMQ